MRRFWVLLLLVTGFAALCDNAFAVTPLNLSGTSNLPVGRHIAYLQAVGKPLDLDDAVQAYIAGRFVPAKRAVMNFGIGAPPVWLAIQIENPSDRPLQRRISINTSWIDRIDLYFVDTNDTADKGHVPSQNTAAVHQQVGDSLPFHRRPMESRYFDVPHAFNPGITTVFMHVQTPDPMILPIYLRTPEQDATAATLEAYTYGFVYGALAALLGYNFILFLRLKIWRYAFYSIYLSSFIVTNLAYTGHGYWWLWPNCPRWQQWSNPVLMVLYGACGLVFAIFFLDTRQHLPRLHRFVVASVAMPVVVEILAAVVSDRVTGLLLAFSFILFFSLLMLLLGVVSWRNGLTYAKYFLVAALAAVVGASFTAITVWGLVPFSNWGYRAAEVGTMFEAALLALALADQFRVSVEQKNLAEQLARIDPLTGLNNRRGFYDLALSVWNTGLRHRRHMSVIMLDLDHFKRLNDTFGHPAGDWVLQVIADELRRTARVGDIVARWGGEEFTLLLPETTLQDAVSVASRLRTNIKTKTLEHQGEVISLTASFGVSHVQANNADLDELIQAADQQLYVAKQHGRDQVCSVDTDKPEDIPKPNTIIQG